MTYFTFQLLSTFTVLADLNIFLADGLYISFMDWQICFCLRSRPGDPNVVCQSVSQLVRGHVEMT